MKSHIITIDLFYSSDGYFMPYDSEFQSPHESDIFIFNISCPNINNPRWYDCTYSTKTSCSGNPLIIHCERGIVIKSYTNYG